MNFPPTGSLASYTKYSYLSKNSDKRIMGMTFGDSYTVIYMIIKNTDDILRLGRCLDSGTGLDILESNIDSEAMPFTLVAFEYSKVHSILAIVRTDDVNPSIFTIVSVMKTYPFDV